MAAVHDHDGVVRNAFFNSNKGARLAFAGNVTRISHKYDNDGYWALKASCHASMRHVTYNLCLVFLGNIVTNATCDCKAG